MRVNRKRKDKCKSIINRFVDEGTFNNSYACKLVVKSNVVSSAQDSPLHFLLV